MSSQTDWQCLSVQKFFSLCNWSGALPLGQTDWQCLSVQEFFSLCNWQGQPLEKPNWHYTDPSLCLTLQVKEFFQFIPWEGSPQIGSLPKASSIPDPTPSSVETTLTDFCELF